MEARCGRMLVTAVALRCVAAASRTTARADDARDFIADAKLFYRVVACGGSEALPDERRQRDRRQALRGDAEALRALHRQVHHTRARVLRDRAADQRADDGRLSVRRWRSRGRRSSRIPTRARSRRSRSSTPAIRRASPRSTRRRSRPRCRTTATRSRACSRSTTRRARTCASSSTAASRASCRSTSPA